jgi:hypothetical protein
MMKKKNKYEEESFAHWLAMYDIHQGDWTKESIDQQIDLYKSMEGEDEFKSLQDEVKLIVANNDLHLFLDKPEQKVKLSDLQFMANVIVSSE